MVEISWEKRGIGKGCIEIEDWGTSEHLYWGPKKISCKACLVFYCFFGAKRIAFKSSIFFHPLIVEFFWFAYDSNSRKGNTPRLLPIYPRGEQMTYVGDVKECFAWGTSGRGKLYRLTKKWTSSKTFFEDFLLQHAKSPYF